MTARLRVTFQVWPFPACAGDAPRLVAYEGQVARTLLHAIQAGQKGFTAAEISSWALRLSHYVFCLRGDGLTVTCDREDHDGPAGPGWHGRYRLMNRVGVVETGSAKAAAQVAA
jgi:hypothetical protein